MANAWVVSKTGVTKNGTAVANYLGHRLEFRNSSESNGEQEVTLVIRIDDQTGEAQRNAQVAMLPAAIKNTLNQENSIRPTVREIRAQVGDTIDVTGIGTVTVAYAHDADVAGVDPAP